MLDLKTKLFSLSLQHWLDIEVFSWRWFVKIMIIALFIFIFYKFINKTLNIIAFGFMISLVSTVLDIVGTYFIFWEYPYRVLPVEFSEIHDLVVIPIAFMLIYQYFIKWKPFIIANAILSAISSFVMEPVFIMLNFYKSISWKHIYSFPIFFALPILCKLIINRLKPDTN
ncbi:MAG: hypothetical protein K0R50_3854 [Eubacterium sp.]|nr:hypothetical protein [Eubacterium sp.]